MNCSVPGFSVHHYIPEFAQTHESVMSSNHLILCCPLLPLPSIFPSIRIFSKESALCIRWSKYWSFSISPSNEYSVLISFRIDWFDLLAVQGTLKSLRKSLFPDKLGQLVTLWLCHFYPQIFHYEASRVKSESDNTLALRILKWMQRKRGKKPTSLLLFPYRSDTDREPNGQRGCSFLALPPSFLLEGPPTPSAYSNTVPSPVSVEITFSL